MKKFRILVIIYACVVIIGGIFLITKSINISHVVFFLYFLLGALLLVIGTFFEQRYKSKSISKKGWQPTGERFIDTTSGKTIEVYYNFKTGERSYKEIKAEKI